MHSKKWGEYNTFRNPEVFETMDEIDIWKKISDLSSAIYWARHDEDKPWAARVSYANLVNAQYNLEYLVYFTKKFGVEFSREPSDTEHVERSSTFKAWYTFWKKHFDSMDDEKYNQFVEDKSNGKDISKYMPEGNWKDSLEKETTI